MKEFNETENRIIEAAAQVFLEKGKAGARTQMIADVAGINKALLHYYFRSKEKLYDIVAERVIHNAFNQIIGNITETRDFETFLKQFLHNYLKTISSNPMIPRFMLWELEAGGGRIAQIIKSVFQMDKPKDNPLFQIVEKAIAGKQIRPIEPVHFIISLIAVCVAPFVARPIIEKIIPGLDIRSKEFVAAREKAVFDLFWNGIKVSQYGADKADLQEVLTRDWMLW